MEIPPEYTPPAAKPAPATLKERIEALDIIRGFALCGILLMNIMFFGMPYMAGGNPLIFNELASRANHFWWSFINFFMEGSMRGLFSMMFGASALLLLSRLEKKFSGMLPADIYFRRLLYLLLFGLVNGYLLNWAGDILYHYAIVGMFIFPFRKASPKLLIRFVVFFIILTFVAGYMKKQGIAEMREKGTEAIALKQAGKELDEEQQKALETWEGMQQRTNIDNQRKEAKKLIETMGNGSYGDIMTMNSAWVMKFESKKFYGIFFFDIIIFFLAGMYLYKRRIITGEKSQMFYFILSVVGYAIGISEGYLSYQTMLKSNFEMMRFFENYPLPFPIYQVHRLGTTLGHLGLLMVLYKSGLFTWLMKAFSVMGRMAFSNYLGQSIICSLIFYGYGFGYYGKLQRFELYYVWVGIILFQLLFSFVWLRYFNMGPLEWLWRSLTYWKRQPILRKHHE